MDSYFDHVAAVYDKEFTHTEIGKKQRQIVYEFLEPRLQTWNDILEVNCGTGEDALWLAQNGRQVLATDISKEMIRIAAQKLTAGGPEAPRFRQLDVRQLEELGTEQRYDLVFSNFGGLNCLDPQQLHSFLRTARQNLLRENGSIVLVLMSKGSIWETLFYLRKLDFRKAFRRYTNKALQVNVNGIAVPTWYYNPSFFRSLGEEFRVATVQTVGFLLPPSYLEPVFARYPRLLQALFSWERRLKNIAVLAGYSDHYLIELRPK